MCQSGYLNVDFVFYLVEIEVNSQIPWAKHLRQLNSDSSVKPHMPALGFACLLAGIQWIMVANVYSSDYRYRCVIRSLLEIEGSWRANNIKQAFPGARHVRCRVVTVTWQALTSGLSV